MTNKLMLTVAVLLMLGTGLSAQTAFSASRTQVTHIPFSFVADDHTFPAGNYVVETDQPKQLLLLRGENQAPRIIMANRQELSAAPGKGELVFHRYGNQFVLKAVRAQGSWEAQTLPTGKVERELAKVGQPQQVVMVQAGSR
jgi:hypothetical protein